MAANKYEKPIFKKKIIDDMEYNVIKNFYDAYSIDTVLGEGVYGQVTKIESVDGIFAMKRIEIGQVSLADTVKEANILKKMENVKGVIKYKVSFYERFSNSFYILMDLFEGRSLKEYIENPIDNINVVAFTIFKQVLKTLRDIHKLGIAHRDLKLENIMINKHDNKKNSHR